MKNSVRPLLFGLLSGVLMAAGWYWNLTVAVFFAWVPLLLTEDRLSAQVEKGFLKTLGLAYLCFLAWNVLVTWWVVYASVGGACMAFIFNSLFMSLVFAIWAAIKNKLKTNWADWLLIPLWLAWEHGHTLWDLTWTWLTLGNVFAFTHNWVQWYEYTGTSGGSAWILAVNILVYRAIKNNQGLKLFSAPVVKIAAAIIVPVFLSYVLLLVRLKDFSSVKIETINTVVVQPNIDPYNAKFNWDFSYQFGKSLRLIEGKVNEETDYLVFPETFITENLNEEGINFCEEIKWFRDSILIKFPKLKIITGANTYVIYKDGTSSATARKDERGFYFDIYNTALMIDSANIQVYHKSKLVPGVERMPFPALLKPLESLAIDMGGTMGSLGTQAGRSVFSNTRTPEKIAPVVCYESIFADYNTQYTRLGSDAIFIITNDGWWDNSPGYKQHLQYARLRAIENRLDIARCANTGISCFIDRFGNTSSQTEWWKEAVISQKVALSTGLTFFARFGDLISYFSVAITILVLLFAGYQALKRS